MKNLPKIIISVVPHKKQRYPTAGDYYEKKGDTHITVSKMGANHEFLVAIHELIEWYLIKQKGISMDKIDAFDIKFEKNRPENNLDEPGDDPKAPYYDEHQFATAIEKLLADKLGVHWQKYEDYCNSL